MKENHKEELFIHEQIEQIKKQKVPSKELLDTTKARVQMENPEKVYQWSFRLLFGSVMGVVCFLALYVIFYAYPTSKELMQVVEGNWKDTALYEEHLEEAIAAIEYADGKGYISQDNQKKLREEYLALFGQYYKKDGEFYNELCAHAEKMLTDVYEEPNSQEEESEEENKPEYVFKKTGYWILWNRANIYFGEKEVLPGGKAEEEIMWNDMCYTFVRTKDGWKIEDTEDLTVI